MKNNHLMILLCCLLASCSVTKNLPEGEKLYVGIDRMEVLNEDKTEAGITALTEVEPRKEQWDQDSYASGYWHTLRWLCSYREYRLYRYERQIPS